MDKIKKENTVFGCKPMNRKEVRGKVGFGEVRAVSSENATLRRKPLNSKEGTEKADLCPLLSQLGALSQLQSVRFRVGTESWDRLFLFSLYIFQLLRSTRGIEKMAVPTVPTKSKVPMEKRNIENGIIPESMLHFLYRLFLGGRVGTATSINRLSLVSA
ncbi:MAG: hypothetical protein AAF358_13595 [Pseudomonadota bacterium]